MLNVLGTMAESSAWLKQSEPGKDYKEKIIESSWVARLYTDC